MDTFSTANLTAEMLSSLVDASAAINAAGGLDETLAAITRAAAAVMRAEGASAILLDPVRGRQVFRAAVGDRAEQLVGVEYAEGAGISGKVLRTGQAVIVHDVRREKAYYRGIDERMAHVTRSLIAAPLTHAGRRIGVVEALNPLGRQRFAEADLELCRVFANLAAIAAANAELHDRLARENRGLKRAMKAPAELVGDGPALREVKDLIARVAGSEATVLLLGETGTGKELAARAIHAGSPRRDGPFIPVNCAALPEALLESELFGHEAGAFTGAAGRRAGYFELASGGTIFLDEIAEASADTQVKLLRVLEDRQTVRVGGTHPVACDVRVIAATNRDLGAETAGGRFRSDLYYRLNVFPIRMPALRERREDIPHLARHLARRLAAELNVPAPELSDAAVGALCGYDFPGNVRELENLLERACLLCRRPGEGGEVVILPEHLPPGLARRAEAARAGAPPNALADAERAMVLDALRRHGWNQTRAARALGISRDNLRYRAKKYGLRRPR